MDTLKSSFNHNNYEFITNKSSDIPDTLIKYAENIITRFETIKKLSEITKNMRISVEIELGIFEYSLIYCISNLYNNEMIKPIYDEKVYEILLNLDENERLKNNYLLAALLTNEINPKSIAFLSPNELFPSKWNIYVKKMEYKKWREDNIDFTKTYKCPNCGEYKSRVHQVQTRSADEPPTTFVICLVCKFSQKIE